MCKASNCATVPQRHNPAGMPKASLDLVRSSSLVELPSQRLLKRVPRDFLCSVHGSSGLDKAPDPDTNTKVDNAVLRTKQGFTAPGRAKQCDLSVLGSRHKCFSRFHVQPLINPGISIYKLPGIGPDQVRYKLQMVFLAQSQSSLLTSICNSLYEIHHHLPNTGH